MNADEFNDIINGKVLNPEQLRQLEELAIKFPYFAVPHILVAKEYVKNNNQFSELKIRSAAVHTTNRRHLKELIHNQETIEIIASIIVETPFKETEIALEEVASIPEETEVNAILPTTLEEVKPEETIETPVVEEKVAFVEEPKLPITEVKIDPIVIISHIDPISESTTEVIKNEVQHIESNVIDTPKHELQPEFLTEDELFRKNLEKHLSDLKKEREKLDLYIAEQTKKKQEEKTKKEDVVSPSIPELKLEIPILETPKYKKKETPSKEERQEHSDKPKEDKPEKKEGYFIKKKNENTNYQMDSDGTDFILDYLEMVNKERKQLFRDKKETEKIIDEFIKKDPKIKKGSLNDAVPEIDLSDKSVKANNLATENLANIYIKQGNFSKAIDIYEQLILKYPEKKVYFADQIEKLKRI